MTDLKPPDELLLAHGFRESADAIVAVLRDRRNLCEMTVQSEDIGPVVRWDLYAYLRCDSHGEHGHDRYQLTVFAHEGGATELAALGVVCALARHIGIDITMANLDSGQDMTRAMPPKDAVRVIETHLSPHEWTAGTGPERT